MVDRRRWYGLVCSPMIFWLAWTASLSCCASELTSTQRYFYELRQRRLFGLAEDACRQMLADDGLSRAQRLELTIELSRSLAEHAKFTIGEEQSDLWQSAVQVVDDQLQRGNRYPQRLRLQVQKALVLGGRGEFLRWQVELSPYDPSLRHSARDALRTAIVECKGLQQPLAAQILNLGQRPPVAGELRREDVRRLQSNVRFRLGLALLDYADLFDNASAERVSAIIDAEALFRRLAGGLPDQLLTQRSQLMLMKCRRLRGQLGGLADRLQKMLSASLAELHNEIVVERVRVLLAEGQLADAVQVTLDEQRIASKLSGELHFLRMLALLESWNLALRQDKTELAEQLMSQVRTAAERVQTQEGGYWAVRCARLLEYSQDVRKYGTSLAHLVRRAQAEYLAGEITDAIATYASVVADARKSNRPLIAASMALTRASILLDTGQFAAAEQALREMFTQFPTDINAPRAHLLWAYTLGRLYDADRTEQRRIDYANALQEHHTQYAASDTRFEAMWMLARLEERRLQYTKALTLYLRVPHDHARAADAQTHAARCYEHILRRLRELGRPVGAWRNEARKQLSAMTHEILTQKELGLLQMELLVRLARIQLDNQPDFPAADHLLQRVLSGLSQTESSATTSEASYRSWLKKLATQLRILSLAGQDRNQEARQLVKQIAGDSATEVLQVLNGLSKLGDTSGPTVRGELGELQLQTALSLDRRRGELSAADRQHLDQCLAQSYLATRQPRKAMEVYAKLVKRSPRDPELLATAAEVMMDIGSTESVRRAKQHWRSLESLYPAGDPRWLNARYHVARCCFLLKEDAECSRLINLTRLLYPGGGGSILRARFAELERAVAGRRR